METNQTNQTYISYLKLEQPQIWLSILRAAEDGLIFVDEANDSVTATARLLLTYPDLHEVFNMLTEKGKIKRYVAKQYDKHSKNLPKD
ncbi:MAG: hypothetical protein COB67_05245, partial [SAR324 cluster bacterium]